MFTIKIVKRIQDSTIVMSLIRQTMCSESYYLWKSQKVGVIITKEVIKKGKSIFIDAPFRQ